MNEAIISASPFPGVVGRGMGSAALRYQPIPSPTLPLKGRGRTGLVRLAILMFLTLTLAACGFQLRGSTELPFRTLWVGFSDASPLGTEFKRYIRSGTSTRLVDDPATAEAKLQVISESREKDILSLDATGQVRQYTLYYIFVFRVDDGKGRDFIAPTRITLKRDISVDNNTILAKQAEENLLYRDMQSDLVQQLLRRLAAVKPDAGAS